MTYNRRVEAQNEELGKRVAKITEIETVLPPKTDNLIGGKGFKAVPTLFSKEI